MTQSSQQVPAVIAPVEHGRLTEAILDFVSQVPDSKVGNSADPAGEARRLANRAAQRAALTAGSLALPPGPLGWLTLLPELIAIWKIQAQMVSDIAAAYGRHASLGREQMMWCLFRHTAAQAFRDLCAPYSHRTARTPVALGIHWGTFKLTDEPMAEPPARARAAWRAAGFAPEQLWVLQHGETRWAGAQDAAAVVG